MHFNELVKGVRGALKAIKIPGTQTLNQDIVKENELTTQELDVLLSNYQKNDQLIDNEALLEPFYTYLTNRYKRIALTSLNYQNHPNIWANHACHALAKYLVAAVKQCHGQARQANDLLMPSLVWRMDELAGIFLEQINQLLKQPVWQIDIFVALESYLSLQQLQRLLAQYQHDRREVAYDLVKPILDLFEQRWVRIEDSDSDYIYNQLIPANLIYYELAKGIYMILQMSKKDIQGLSTDRLLRPLLHSHQSKPDNEFRQTILCELQREYASENTSQKPLMQLLQSMAIKESDLGALICHEVDAAVSDDINSLSLPIYLESRETIKSLVVLAEQFRASDKPVGRSTLSTLIDFFGQRWKGINGTPAAYSAHSQATANKICSILADVTALLGYRIDYLKRDPAHILMRTPEITLSAEESVSKLRQQIVKPVIRREHLLEQLINLPGHLWKNYLDYFETSQLVMLLTHGKAEIGAVMEMRETFAGREVENKALLFTMLTVYERVRSEIQSNHTSYLGTLSNKVVYVPTREEKLSAVTALKQMLTTSLPLTEISRTVTDKNSTCYIKHHQAFNDGSLKYFVDQIRKAAQAESDRELFSIQTASRRVNSMV